MYDLDHADRIFLEACRDRFGELELVVCREGKDDPEACAMRAHAETMVVRGYLQRLTIAGTRSRMQGAALRVTYRAHELALVLLEMAERLEALEAEIARGRSRKNKRPENPN